MSSAVLAHDVLGDGPRTTFLLHGLLGNRRNLGSLARRLCRKDPRRRAVLIDLPGHGDSPPISLDAGLSNVAEQVLSLLESLKEAGPLELIGHSLGGRVALAALEISSDLIDSLTLLDIAPGPVPGHLVGEVVMRLLREAPSSFETRRQARSHFMERGLPRELANWLAMNLATRRDDGRVEWKIDREAIAGFHLRQGRENLWEVVEHAPFGVTLRCIRGERSPYVTATDERRLKAAGVSVDVLPRAGHFVHIDARDELVQLLLDT